MKKAGGTATKRCRRIYDDDGDNEEDCGDEDRYDSLDEGDGELEEKYYEDDELEDEYYEDGELEEEYYKDGELEEEYYEDSGGNKDY